jgi:hypothetical protein
VSLLVCDACWRMGRGVEPTRSMSLERGLTVMTGYIEMGWEQQPSRNLHATFHAFVSLPDPGPSPNSNKTNKKPASDQTARVGNPTNCNPTIS